MSDATIKVVTKKPRSIINVLALINRARVAAGVSKIASKPRVPKTMKLNQSQKDAVGFEVLEELYPDYLKPEFQLTEQIAKALKAETENRVKLIINGKKPMPVSTLTNSKIE